MKKNKTWRKKSISSPSSPRTKSRSLQKTWRKKSLGGKKKNKKRFKPTSKRIFLLVAFLFLFGASSVTAIFAWINHNLPQPDKLFQREVAQSTKIYDRNGKTILYEIFADQKRTLIKLEDIPQHTIWATIVVEDRDFFQHPGFDLKAILRSIIVDLIQGNKAQGGSTLTQQFVKNAFLTSEKTYVRKIKELLLAYQIEKKFSKQEILQMYFNEIPYGSNAYGIEAASQIYFNKSARHLTLDESALLAALTKATTYYSPYGNQKEELIQRRNHILEIMATEGYITKEISEQAQKIDTLSKIALRQENIIAPHFVMYVRRQLIEKYGQRQVEQGGLKVITTLDVTQQRLAEETIEQYAQRNQERFNASNAALISIDAQTGEILSWVGSKDFFDQEIDGQVDIITANRQPGSSFKPIVYAAALEKGLTPETILFDTQTNFGRFGNKDYIPQNYNQKYYGPVSIRQSLAGSLNVPAVKTLYLTGVQEVINLAQKMDYTTLIEPSRYGLSLALGSAEVKLLEHASAFGIFAREGKKIPTTYLLQVKDSAGKILEENDTQYPETQQVLSPQVARQINDILSDNQARSFVFGENNNLTLPDRPVAAKTGTTNNALDAWTIGYTPNRITGVWVGNNNNEAMAEKADGSTLAGPIWKQYMQAVLQNTPPQKFTKPEKILTEKPILNGQIPEDTITLKIDKASQKIATELTPPSFVEEKVFQNYYPLLKYIDKDDPRGPAPLNPSLDPQYNRWQEGISEWLAQDSKRLSAPPAEYDDLHIPFNQPSLTILSPYNGQTIDNQTVKVNIKSSSARGIKKIKCSLDNIALDLITISSPQPNQEINTTCQMNLSGVEAGQHKITVIASDDIENQKSESIWISTASSFEQRITWLGLANGQEINQQNIPFDLSLLIPALSLEKIRFFAQKESENALLLSTIFSPESAGVTNFTWTKTDPGSYQIWAEIIDQNGQFLSSEVTSFEILP
ncbi:PBP1A family penicillin-binding protein [Patescibacteria group bacterium]|nr:PBP1A family penicillin-binding protein [Patescibacteria group bacterium]